MGEGFMGNLMLNSYSLGMKLAQNFKAYLIKTVYAIKAPIFTSSAFVTPSHKKKKNLQARTA
jgi:hypothetical protein